MTNVSTLGLLIAAASGPGAAASTLDMARALAPAVIGLDLLAMTAAVVVFLARDRHARVRLCPRRSGSGTCRRSPTSTPSGRTFSTD